MGNLTPDRRAHLAQVSTLGQRAQQLLDDEVFQMAFAAPELSLFRRWSRTKPDQFEERETIYHESNALEKVRKRLTNLRDEGTRARKALEDDEG